MQTLKTAVVVVLLLVVLYGAYDILTRPVPEPPPEVASALGDSDSLAPPDVQFEGPVVVNPDQPASDQSPAPPLGEATPPSHSSQDAAAAGSPSTTTPGIPVEPQPPVSRFVPPASPPAPADPRLQRNPFLHERAASTSESATTSATGGDASSESSETDASTASVPVHDEQAGDHATSSGSSASDSDAEPLRAGERAYQRVRVAAQRDVSAGRYREALAKLSIFYRSPDLSPEEHAELLDWLDPLAARVIYSRESLLEEPYIVRKNDTLAKIAEAYQVPWQLLQKINGVANPDVLVPGTSLKVVRGPFRAEVRLSESEITVFLGELYAGRFPITLGNDPQPTPGDYQVRDKQTQRTYYGANRQTIPPGNPLNPYGDVWIDLGSDVCIHGSPARPSNSAGNGPAGCIGLSPGDADDIYAILSVGSTVKIRP